MPNILVTSLGTSWAIIPELIGFTNPEVYDLYKNHPDIETIQKRRIKYGIEHVNELWVVTTNGTKVSENLSVLKNWIRKTQKLPKIKLFSYDKLVELSSIEEIQPMSDLIYRTVLFAKKETKGGKLFLSLAGGRKNMSADIQNAANIFGCDALLHVMDNGNIDNIFYSEEAFFTIPDKEIECFTPIVLQKKLQPSPILFAEPKIIADDYPISATLKQKGSKDLFNEIQKRQSESSNSLLSIYKKRSEDSQTTYSAFQLLAPEVVEKLKKERIGASAADKTKDIHWLKKIPKAELHCHFGGILSPAEIIEVALELQNEVDFLRKVNLEFDKCLTQIEEAVHNKDLRSLPDYNPKQFREDWKAKKIDEPFAIAGLLLSFKDNAKFLKKYIYNHVGNFKQIGFKTYEKLGDLQGSSLLQNEVSIRKTCEILKRQCIRNNIKYCEVRCSPVNYTRSCLKSNEVVEIMIDEFKNQTTIFKLIFIASRHKDGNDSTKAHIKLALDMLESSDDFKNIFVGFDLAGNESVKRPEELRDVFMDILERSIPTTIHAGEGITVKSIWGAVYHLSAERIGHGLTLNDDENLKQRFKERKIAIELCPSSNDQIIGYHDYHKPVEKFTNKIYPLKQYLADGLKVTINTDDPGISLTTLSNEYYKAACMTEGGLSKWEILQINRNGFKYGFLPLEEKKIMLLEVETELFEILNQKN